MSAIRFYGISVTIYLADLELANKVEAAEVAQLESSGLTVMCLMECSSMVIVVDQVFP